MRTYNIFRKLENREIVLIASRYNWDEADQLVRSLSEYWAAEYVILLAESAAPEEKTQIGSSTPGPPETQKETRHLRGTKRF